MNDHEPVATQGRARSEQVEQVKQVKQVKQVNAVPIDPHRRVESAPTAHLDVDLQLVSGFPTLTLGQRIAALRRAAGLSQAQLAGTSGAVSASMISLIETGKRTPGPEVIDHVAARLGVHPDQLPPTAGALPTPGSQVPTWRVTIRPAVTGDAPRGAAGDHGAHDPDLSADHGKGHRANHLPEQTYDVVATSAPDALRQVARLMR